MHSVFPQKSPSLRFLCSQLSGVEVINSLILAATWEFRVLTRPYNLKQNSGDLKTTQGDTGHAEIDVITRVCAHILDEDLKING